MKIVGGALVVSPRTASPTALVGGCGNRSPRRYRIDAEFRYLIPARLLRKEIIDVIGRSAVTRSFLRLIPALFG
ncbi:hypothetical protein [Amycolatopsis sp. SID8362]|uniref:hypothetical protein n=1 Tax=Amycolatopsis sp. SID8362 TaxID=2690346 RepID=UPI001368B9EB|nr:hypothetical protein [Amycolatopsis sp. SID8362]NBH09560.1 hypothetical protein [Amycolatopsis sp. SID8362]NED46252.1 hypothetical protein [Amycolatopsis sp. SID8362]